MFRQEEKTKSTESSRRKSEFFQQYGRDVPMLLKVKTKAKAEKENFLPAELAAELCVGKGRRNKNKSMFPANKMQTVKQNKTAPVCVCQKIGSITLPPFKNQIEKQHQQIFC